MIFRRHLLFLFLLAAPAAAAPKDPPPAPPPPMPQSQNVSLFRGRSVEIPLRAIGRAPSQLKFLIRSRPAVGRLGPIRLTGPKSAVITYHHDDTAGSGTLFFTYAVQGVDTAVSAPARVTLTISEEPPALSVVHALDFGELTVGQSREEHLVVRNTGGGSLTGKILAPAPWKISGSPDYRLARHQETRFRLVFAPDSAGTFEEKLTFSHDARSTVALTGRATAPLTFDPPNEIELSGDGAVRSTTLRIRNTTPFEREVLLTAPPEIAAPAEVTLPPNAETTVSLETQPDFSAALESHLIVESEGFRREIPLRVFAQAPDLEVKPSSGLDFGEVQPGRRHKADLQITNQGGRRARLTAKLPPGLLLVPDPNTVLLAPAEKRVFEVAFETSAPGTYRGRIEIGAEGSASITLPVTAWGAGPSASAPKIPTTQLAPETPEPTPDSPRAGTKTEPVSSIPAIGDITIHPAENRNLEISWKKPAANAVGYVIEQRYLGPGSDGVPEIVWKERRGIKFLEENDRPIARFENMAPGQTWFFRIRSVDETGRRSAPSPTIRIATAPPPKTGLWWLLGLLLVVATTTLIAHLVRKRRQATHAAETARLARLDQP